MTNRSAETRDYPSDEECLEHHVTPGGPTGWRRWVNFGVDWAREQLGLEHDTRLTAALRELAEERKTNAALSRQRQQAFEALMAIPWTAQIQALRDLLASEPVE